MKLKYSAIVLIALTFVLCLCSTDKIYSCTSYSPTAYMIVSPIYVLAGIEQQIEFNATSSYDPDGSGGLRGIYKFEWDYDYDNGSFAPNATETPPCDGIVTAPVTYPTAGVHWACVRVYEQGISPAPFGLYNDYATPVYAGDYRLKITGSNGTVSVNNGTARTLPWSQTFVSGELVKIQAVPNSNCYFAKWSGSAVDAGLVSNAYSATTTIAATVTVEKNYELVANFAAGKIVYADCVNGNNDWNGLYPTHQTGVNGPKKTIKDTTDPVTEGAVTAAVSGDMIILAKGTYVENDIRFNGKSIYFRSSNPDDPFVVASTVIDGTGCPIDPGWNAPEQYYAGVFTFFNSSGETSSVLEGLTITNGPIGVYGYYYSPARISKCIFTNAEYQGIWFTGVNTSQANAEISRCFVNNNYNGIVVNTNGVDINNCVIARSTYMGISTGFSTGESGTITNCTILNNAGYGIGVSNGGTVVKNCILWGNNGGSNQYAGSTVTYSYIQNSPSGGTGNIVTDADPLFENSSDVVGMDGIWGTADDGLHLRKNSPCIDKGTDTGAPPSDIVNYPHVDIAGVGTINTKADMGAYECVRVWYVNKNVVGGSQTGTSWSNAFKWLQDALVNSNLADGDQIWVAWAAQGIYQPDRDSGHINGSGDMTKSFNLPGNVAIYGGFVGTETYLLQRNWKDYKTILSGDLSGNDGSGFVNYGENSYHVVTNAKNAAVLDGFTITGGNANGSSDFDKNGAGIYSYFRQNGQISNCVITGNMASLHGGGIFSDANSISAIQNCVFVSNAAGGEGGGIKNDSVTTVIENCVFTQNTAVTGGGIDTGSLRSDRPAPKIRNCTFYGNIVSNKGGAIRNYNCDPNVTNSIFWDDTAAGGCNEIYNARSIATFRNCDIQGGCSSGDECVDWSYSNSGGNIDDPPSFANTSNLIGADNKWCTSDDGLRLKNISPYSPCIDAADGNYAPWKDIVGNYRIDFDGVDNTGRGNPNYVDIGAYEAQNTSNLYAGGASGGVVYKYLGGQNWLPVSEALGSAVLCFCEFNGNLYAGTMTGLPYSGIGEVWQYDGGTNWTRVGTNLRSQVCALTVFNGVLYAGAGTVNVSNDGTLYRYDGGTSWTQVVGSGNYTRPWQGFRSLYVFNNVIYVGSLMYDLFGRYDGTPFTFTEDFYDNYGSCIWDFQLFSGNLYASADLRRLYKWNSGTNAWSRVYNGGGSYGTCFWELETFGIWLFVADGPRLQRYNGSAFDPVITSPIWTTPDGEDIIAMYTDGTFLILGTGGEAGSEYAEPGAGRIYRYNDAQVESISGNLGDKGIQCLIRH